jgi:hypothetical protein
LSSGVVIGKKGGIICYMQRTAPTAYNADFALWAESQAVALREGRLPDLDVDNLVEEIQGLTKRDRAAIRSRLIQLAAHLLKLRYQPDRATRSWISTVIVQSGKIRLVLEDSPSLRREMPDFIGKAYVDARRLASNETGLPIGTFPETPTPEFHHALAAALAGEDASISH